MIGCFLKGTGKMSLKELYSLTKRHGIQSGIIEITFSGAAVSLDFYDEDTDAHVHLFEVMLAEFCDVKEGYVIGPYCLEHLKTSEEVEMAEQLLKEKAGEMKSAIFMKADELADEIAAHSAIEVEVIRQLQGDPIAESESERNMWIAEQVLTGLDSDY